MKKYSSSLVVRMMKSPSKIFNKAMWYFNVTVSYKVRHIQVAKLGFLDHKLVFKRAYLNSYLLGKWLNNGAKPSSQLLFVAGSLAQSQLVKKKLFYGVNG